MGVERGHPQTTVRYGDRDIQVDTKMVDLLRAMWAAGMDTYGSCENAKRGNARIWFANKESSDRFATLAQARHVSGDRWPIDFDNRTIGEVTEAIMGEI